MSYIDFQTVHFNNFKQFKVDVILQSFGKSKLTLLVHFSEFRKVIIILPGLGKTLCYKKKQSKPPPFDKNPETMHRVRHKSFSIIQSAGIKDWGSPVNKETSNFSLSFLSVTHFTDLSNKMCMIRIKIQKVSYLGIYLLNGYFLRVLPRAVFITQPKVYGGALFCKNN